MPTVDPVELAHLEWMIENKEKEMLAILDARNYYNGVQQDFVPAAMKDILSQHKSKGNVFALNVCESIVMAVANVLEIVGFDTDETADENGVKPQAAWANMVWKANHMAAVQDIVHEGALSDRESFVIVDWNDQTKIPKFVHNEVYIPLQSSGDGGQGVWMVYENDDRFQTALYAVKRWVETTWERGGPIKTSRITFYFDDRIEKFQLDFGDAGMSKITNGDEPFPLPRVDAQSNPLGIPAIHFHNKGYRSEHWKAIPMQDAINRTLADILYAIDLVSKKSFLGFGFHPTTDGKAKKTDNSNALTIGAGVLNTIPDKAPGEASLQEIEGEDPRPTIEALISLITLTAQITDTPVSRFIVTAQIASDDTIKAQNDALDKKAEDRRGLFGEAWKQTMNMARKYANAYGGAGLDESVEFIPLWRHDVTLQELEQKKTMLGIPDEQVWTEAGYSSDKIVEMKSQQSYRIAQERAIWEGAMSATQNIPLDEYLKRCGLSAEEIAEINVSIENQTAVPLTDL